jgi:hypothetical protein
MSRPERAADDVRHIRVHPRTRLALLEEIAADGDALEDELVARGQTGLLGLTYLVLPPETGGSYSRSAGRRDSLRVFGRSVGWVRWSLRPPLREQPGEAV